MTEQEKMKQGYIWKDDEENMALQARTKPGNRGPTECGTTHEATSGMSS